MTKVEITIQAEATPLLMGFIKELIDLSEDWEDVHTVETAFEEMSDRSDHEGWSNLKNPCRRVHIALGHYVEISSEEMESTIVTSGKPYAFKLGGVYYQWR